MATFPGSPQALRGALVTVDPVTLVPSVIAFQYNPHTMARSFEVQGGAGGPEAGQLTGPPAETIQFELIVEASDALDAGEGADGVAPQLAALQQLITPSSDAAIANIELAAAGQIEILPPAGPITLFVWGAKRVEPVAITELAITEEGYDTNLNPIAARVSIGLRVLTHADLAPTHPGHSMSLASQIAREQLANPVLSASLDSALGANVPLI